MIMRMWYSETYYVDVMKTLCNMLNRMFANKGLTQKTRSVVRDVKYWSGQYHYIEKIWNIQIYEIADQSPMLMFKQIIERANERIY